MQEEMRISVKHLKTEGNLLMMEHSSGELWEVVGSWKLKDRLNPGQRTNKGSMSWIR